MARLVFAVLAVVLVFPVAAPAAPGDEPSGRQFRPGSWSAIEDLPAGPFRDRLNLLAPGARERALGWLGRIHFPEADVGSLRADAEGGIYYVCDLAASGSPQESGGPVPAAAPVPVSPFPVSLIFHSRPGAPNVLYLNFAGDTITGTVWNTDLGRSTIPAVVFSTDGDYSTYSDSEQAAIRSIWQRVSEDYAPFDIDVTTERPPVFNNRMANLLITRSTDANGAPNPSSTAGGVAYVDVFNLSSYSSYRPAWVYVDNLGYNEAHIAEAASHEVGHNLGLSHDGRTGGTEYYGGHGSGETSWSTLMGTAYYRNVSQWSKGDYYLANNTEDDLAIITGKVPYRADDHGDTLGGATALVMTGGTNIVSTTPADDPDNTNPANKGVIERATDVDLFSFVTGDGPVRLAVDPWVTPAGTRGNNLDVLLALRDAGGGVVATNNPASQTGAVIETHLPQGLYFLTVRNSGAGDPFSPAPSGYTAYGSLGQYFVSGYVSEAVPFVIPPVADLAVSDLTQPGATSLLFTVTYSDDVALDVSFIDSFDVRVKGPRGYDRLAQLVAVTPLGNGTPRIATYAASAPNGGVWDRADNGAYSLWMEPVQVQDVEGATVTSGLLGTVRVVLPSVLYSADMANDPGWTLESQWEYGTPSYGSTGPSGGFTGTRILGYNLVGNYGNNINPARYATTPAMDCTGSTALTLRFQRWLRLSGGDTALIEASTNGSTWVTLWSTTQGVADSAWQEMTYPLPASMAGSGSVRVRWGLASNAAFRDLGWNLDDVLLLEGGVLDTNPPGAGLTVGNIVSASSLEHPCTVTYTDATAVSVASLDSSDLWVSGPGGYSNAVTFAGADPAADASPVDAGYLIPAPGGVWGWEDNGTYQLTLRAAAVEDVYLNGTEETVLGSFQVTIPSPGVLEVVPTETVTPSGTVGGPFIPTNFVYTLTNSGELALNWVAGANSQWLAAAPTSGVLAAGGTAVVNVSLLSAVNGYAEGTYSGTVFFQNRSGGGGSTTRQVTLTVLPLSVFDVTATVAPAGWGTVAPPGGTFVTNALVELLASPAQYFQFAGWAGDADGTNNPLPLIVQSNIAVMANFAELLTTNHPTPLWWLASLGYTNDFESAADVLGANDLPLWQSHVAGLDPTNPSSQLRLEIEGVEPVVLGWQPVTGRFYSLSLATNELQSFRALPGAVDLPWPIDRFTNAVADQPAAFYRLEVRKP